MYRGEISSSLEPVEKQVATLKEAVTQLDTSCRMISDQQAIIEGKMQITFKELHKVLNARETELNSQLDKIAQGKLDILAAQRDQVDITLTQLSSCLHLIKETLRTCNEGDVMVMKKKTPRQVEDLASAFNASSLKPLTEANIAFVAPADLTLACQGYAQVLAPGVPDPSKCHASGDLEEAILKEKCVAILHTVDSEGNACSEPLQALDCELVSNMAGTRVKCGMERKEQSQYEISYQPVIKGRHHLHIKVEDQHVKGSPFRVAVKSQIEKLGIPVLSIGWVGGPLGVATSENGEVVVTEWEGHCISVFNPRGEKVRSFGKHGSDHGQFDSPHGVAVDGGGNILVADRDNHRIQKFTSDGQFLSAVGSRGSDSLQFINPVDVAFNAVDSKIYVSDEGNHRIQVLNSDLTFSSTFGKKGTGKGRFNQPLGVACDSTGKVFVADSGNHRVQAFSGEGKYLVAFGRRGRGEGELDMPISIAVDNSNMVYVGERNNFRVSVFTSEGVAVSSFGKRGKGPGEFKRLSGLAVDDSGVVYVCDSVGNAVRVF
jgi:tripartite motif-containing protein 2/3/tripartite motif-containing protein 71